MGLFDKLKGSKKRNYAREFYKLTDNGKKSVDMETGGAIALEWMKNGNQNDANYLYFLANFSSLNGTISKEEAIEIFKAAEASDAEDPSLREFYRDQAIATFFTKYKVIVK